MSELISREAFISTLVDEVNAHNDKWFAGIVDAFIREIRKAPAVDAVEVVHGHWVQRWTGNEYIVFCSKCRTEATEIVDYELEYNYCPNCGAKMDEVSE